MCFSATASFTASGTLAVIGTAAITLNKQRRLRIFSFMPLLFAIQQAAEGIVWLTMDKTSYTLLHTIAIYSFLIFPGIIAPLWVSAALRLAETDVKKRRIFTGFGLLGILLAVIAVYSFINDKLKVYVVSCSIAYDFGEQSFIRGILSTLVYVIPTVIPFFFSSIIYARMIGAMLTISLIITEIFKHEAATSVWCFFAALISFTVLATVWKSSTSFQKEMQMNYFDRSEVFFDNQASSGNDPS